MSKFNSRNQTKSKEGEERKPRSWKAAKGMTKRAGWRRREARETRRVFKILGEGRVTIRAMAASAATTYVSIIHCNAILFFFFLPPSSFALLLLSGSLLRREGNVTRRQFYYQSFFFFTSMQLGKGSLFFVCKERIRFSFYLVRCTMIFSYFLDNIFQTRIRYFLNFLNIQIKY